MVELRSLSVIITVDRWDSDATVKPMLLWNMLALMHQSSIHLMTNLKVLKVCFYTVSIACRELLAESALSDLVGQLPRTTEDDCPGKHYGIMALVYVVINNSLFCNQLVIEKDILCFTAEVAGSILKLCVYLSMAFANIYIRAHNVRARPQARGK